MKDTCARMREKRVRCSPRREGAEREPRTSRNEIFVFGEEVAKL